MRRVLIILTLVLAVGGGAVLSTGAKQGEPGTKYTVELDNAFGLIEGADVKVAGVRAGKVTTMDLDRDDMRALIGIELSEKGFGDLRTDVFCETRPQSLIGEYFVDCKPGDDEEKLAAGSTIPVKQTASTIPVDLVNNILRRPYRERLSILLSELGAGLAARGPDLNETIRRAVPALRETDKLLRELAVQRRTIRQLNDDADEVMLELAGNKKDVTRFVQEARDTSSASAERAGDIERQFQRFPTFLRELRPTMRLLGQAADRQVPALRNLNRSADMIETFFDTLGPFSEASRPAFRTLAAAAERGRGAMRAAQPNIRELRRGVKTLPEVSSNLAITLEHLDDPRFTTEKDVRAGRGPDGGYTGFEALLRYIFNQSQSINVFDENSYMLKVDAFLDRDCASYADAQTVKDESKARCRAWMGPNQPGITSPDFTKTSPPAQRGGAARQASARQASARQASARSERASTNEQLLDFLVGP